MPIFDAPTISWTNFNTFVIAVVGRNVWQAEYERLYDPSLEKRAASLVAFTSKFCLQQL